MQVQRVPKSFLVREGIKKLRLMLALLHEDQQEAHWPMAFEYWPQLRSNTLVRGLPYLEDEAVSRYGLCSRRQAPESEQFSFNRIVTNMKALINDFIPKIGKRLLEDPEENRLSESTALLTNLSLFKALAAQYGPQPLPFEFWNNFLFCKHVTI